MKEPNMTFQMIIEFAVKSNKRQASFDITYITAKNEG